MRRPTRAPKTAQDPPANLTAHGLSPPKVPSDHTLAVFATLKLNVRFEVHELEETGDWAWARTSSAGRT
ncbi:MAG: hypothetical protein Q8Q09_17140 [Deltaproteobacteria bacterium]|nr:hypothetical protein [Deltaproteobacteria bacterium]